MLDTILLVKIELLLDVKMFACAEYISLTMVSAKEMLPTAPQIDWNPK